MTQCDSEAQARPAGRNSQGCQGDATRHLADSESVYDLANLAAAQSRPARNDRDGAARSGGEGRRGNATRAEANAGEPLRNVTVELL